MARKPATTPPAKAPVPSAGGAAPSIAALNGTVEVAPPSDAERAAAGSAAARAAITAKAMAAAEPTEAIEVRASRPSYRRAGFVFGDREWTRIERTEDLTVDRLLALIEDPVLSLRGVTPFGVVPLSASDRFAFAQLLREATAAEETGKA